MITSLETIFSKGAPWPPRDMDEVRRLSMYSDNQKLFEGDHPDVFTEVWKRIYRTDLEATIEILLNWPKRLSTLWGDLLLGEIPTVTTEDGDQEVLDGIIKRSNFWSQLYASSIDVSRFGNGLLKSRLVDGKAKISGFPPRWWFPVVNPEDLKEVTEHVLAWPVEISTDKYQLYVQIHRPGEVEYRIYDLSRWSVSSLVEDPHTEVFDCDRPLIATMSNVTTTDRYYGHEDYSDVASIVSEIEVRFAQIARILDKHADPKMYGPASVVGKDENGNDVVRMGDFIVVEKEDLPPGYITWDGQMEANFKEIDLLMEQFYSISETSPSAFGQIKAGLAESGSALKRLLTAPLAKVNRLKLGIDPAVCQALETAYQLETGKPCMVSIAWKDGIPDDQVEVSTMCDAAYVAGTMSLEQVIRRRDGLKGEALEKAVAEIRATTAGLNTPKVTLPEVEEE